MGRLRDAWHAFRGYAAAQGERIRPSPALEGDVERSEELCREINGQAVIARRAADADGVDLLGLALVEHLAGAAVQQLHRLHEIVVAQRVVLRGMGGEVHGEGHEVGREQEARLQGIHPHPQG